MKKSIFIFTIALLLFSCTESGNKTSEGTTQSDSVSVNVDSVETSSVMQGDSLSVNYKENPVSTPLEKVSVSDDVPALVQEDKVLSCDEAVKTFTVGGVTFNEQGGGRNVLHGRDSRTRERCL